MPWSVFTDGGGPAAALAWAKAVLAKIGAPDSIGNEQFLYDWEVSEGGGGAFNPLNQGPVPGQPQLTTTGSQYGGGAADFASWQAGIEGAADYLSMPLYKDLKADLLANKPAAARTALIASPWASGHYSGDTGVPGSAFSTSPLPNGDNVAALSTAISAQLSSGGGTAQTVGITSAVGSALGGVAGLLGIPTPSSIEKSAYKIVVTGVAMLGGVTLIALGAWRTVSPSVQKVESRVQTQQETAAKAAPLAAVA